MDLDRMRVEVRPRTPWEGIDLGFTMARHWFLPLFKIWIAAALPVYLLAALFLSGEPWLVILVVWWCKPLYEPLLLSWLSKALFSAPPSAAEMRRHFFATVRPQLLANLTWRRFSPNRSFYMPVALLEQLKGKERKARIGVLGRGQHAGTWLTFVGVLFELILEISFSVLLIVMLPEELRWIDLEELIFTPGELEQWLQHIGNFFTMALIAPFYVAGGFALYLNRRSELEAWDIEIKFRRLSAQRSTRKRPLLSPLIVPVLVGGVLLSSQPSPAQALELDHQSAKALIEEVLEHRDFGEKKQIRQWVVKDGDKAEEKDDSHWFWDLLLEFIEGFTEGYATIGKLLLWIAGGLLLGYLIYRIALSREWLGLSPAARQQQRKAPVTLFGLDIAAESLPEDLASALRELIEQGDLRGALSLLYRGALFHLVQDHIEIPDSATEQECLRLVQQARSEPEVDLFERLTRLWVASAYGHRLPETEQVVALVGDWQRIYGTAGEHV